MYASRDPSGEMATRPDQGAPGAIASVESIARVDRTTCFAGTDASNPERGSRNQHGEPDHDVQHPPIARPRSLTSSVDAATDRVTDLLSEAVATLSVIA